jgi:hypothetical protein
MLLQFHLLEHRASRKALTATPHHCIGTTTSGPGDLALAIWPWRSGPGDLALTIWLGIGNSGIDITAATLLSCACSRARGDFPMPTADPAARWPNYTEADFVIKNYVFASGESLPELRLHNRTMGVPRRD